MNIHPDFVTETDEWELSECIKKALAKIPERKGQLRNRVLRFGWDYLQPEKWLGGFPYCLQPWNMRTEPLPCNEPVTDLLIKSDSITINEYLRGQVIAPHIDSKAFGDVAILSLLADATMRFVSPATRKPFAETRDFILPRRSLIVISGEHRTTWTHETLPLEADLRYSVVYRRRL